jgi:hypothetical protein
VGGKPRRARAFYFLTRAIYETNQGCVGTLQIWFTQWDGDTRDERHDVVAPIFFAERELDRDLRLYEWKEQRGCFL